MKFIKNNTTENKIRLQPKDLLGKYREKPIIEMVISGWINLPKIGIISAKKIIAKISICDLFTKDEDDIKKIIHLMGISNKEIKSLLTELNNGMKQNYECKLLEGLDGIGYARAECLINTFGSMKNLATTSREKLSQTILGKKKMW